MTAELDVEGLTKSFGRTVVLRGIDLHVPAGSLTAVLGPSGCGKTTLLRLVAGFDRPDGGTIRLGGRLLADAAHALAPERRHIGYVAQEGALFPHLTVAANITFGLPWTERRRRAGVGELLELVGLEAGYARRYPHELSGGQQQRIALARALAPRPAVVLLDEPFSSLDAGLRDSTRRAVADALAERGTTTVLVTHDQSEALSLADQVAVMHDGRLSQVAAPITLYQTPADTRTARFVGDALLLPATIAAGRATTPLGVVPLAKPAGDGPATVLVRPEQLTIATAGSGGGRRATVVRTTFYGHDALVELALDDGTPVTARVPGHATPRPGTAVAVAVTGSVHAIAPT